MVITQVGWLIPDLAAAKSVLLLKVEPLNCGLKGTPGLAVQSWLALSRLWWFMHSTRYWLVALTTPPAGSAVITRVNGYYEADVGGYQDSTQEGLNKLRALGVTIVALIPRKQKANEWKTLIH